MDSKEDAANRMGLFLQILFSTIKTTEIALGTTNKGDLVLIDNQKGYQKVYRPKEIEKLYQEYINKAN